MTALSENPYAAELDILLGKLEKSNKISEMGAICLGGSHAYGLATPDSDVDLRGFAMPKAEDILRLRDFEQVDTMDGVDATIYSLHKMTSLLAACNPNIIEMVGLREQDILVDSPAYKTLREHPEWFVSRKCASTFGGYATQQLRRIQNAMNREDDARLIAESAKRSMDAAIEAFPAKFASYAEGGIVLSVSEEAEPEVLVDISLSKVPARELRGMCGDLDDINKNAARLGKNKRRESKGIAKHASHLIRLLAMGSEMLETGAVNTFRSEDAGILLELKQGKYLVEEADGTRRYEDEFWEMLDAAEKRFQYAKANTSLPADANREAIDAFLRGEHLRLVETYSWK